MIAIINGPNLNCLGRREPEIYGTRSFENYLEELKKRFGKIEIQYFQSNSEGEIIDAIQKYGFDTPDCMGIIVNPGAYSHYSYAIADAISSIPVSVVEVHISNIASRDDFRHTTVTGGRCKGVISGFGLEGYAMAVDFLARK